MPHKLVDWLELKKAFPAELKVELRKAFGEDFDEKLFEVLKRLHKGIQYLSTYVEVSTELILARAKEQGVSMYPYRRSCSRSCATCLGDKPFHFPYFKYKDKVGKGYKDLSTRHTNEFFTRLGLTEQQIRMHDRAVWARHKLIAMFHALIINFNYVGATTLALEKPVEEATVEA